MYTKLLLTRLNYAGTVEFLSSENSKLNARQKANNKSFFLKIN